MPNKELLLIPGPTPVVDDIYEALARETWGHTDPRFAALFKESLEKTRRLLNTDGEVFVFAGSGTLAMEMAIVNTVAPGERLLVISHGYFGDRFVQLAEAYGIDVTVLQAPWGQHIDPDQVRRALWQASFRAVTITHADTSTGVAAQLESLVPIIKAHGALCILDGVCATAAMDEDMQRGYGSNHARIDVVLTASQKAIGMPPGLGIVAFGPEALAARRKRTRVPAYFLDIACWEPVMHDPTRYFATPPVNLIYAYHRALDIVLTEGLEARFRRHRAMGRAVRAALRTYGFEPLATEDVAAPTLTCFQYPEGIDDGVFRRHLAELGVVVAGALGPLAGRAFRMGHMGNVTQGQLAAAVTKIGEVMSKQGRTVDPVRAIEVLNDTWRDALSSDA
jgi:alanine-glyoxylate transaminase/serine-glyoxylate transaminase/serine-pyruvate transaminase